MGESISVSRLQAGDEPGSKLALFGQDSWAESRSISAGARDDALRQGEIAALLVSANRPGVVLEVSGSMSQYIEPLRAQIRKHFRDGEYAEVEGRRFGAGLTRFNAQPAFERLVTKGACDCCVSWFCDIQDARQESALNSPSSLLRDEGARLYVRSLGRKPDAVLAKVIATSGVGGAKHRSIDDDLMSH